MGIEKDTYLCMSLKNTLRCLKFSDYLDCDFLFYSDEHLPIHVHVKNGAGEAKFEIAKDKIILKQSFGMKSKDLKMAEDLIMQHQDLIIDHWIKYFNK